MESMKMSAASDKCVIDVDILSRYIPREEPNLLPAKSSSYQDSPEAAAEREAIIRSIIQLRQDVDYLKSIITGAAPSRPQLPSIAPPETMQSPAQEMSERYDDIDEDPEEQDFDEPETEVLSIKSSNMELIEKVLRKHGGNRKAAAAELGISERTLYRKLKQK
jgi:DNA-binding NtrC family response regulator